MFKHTKYTRYYIHYSWVFIWLILLINSFTLFRSCPTTIMNTCTYIYIYIGVAINKKWILHSVFIQFYFKITHWWLGRKGNKIKCGWKFSYIQCMYISFPWWRRSVHRSYQSPSVCLQSVLILVHILKEILKAGKTYNEKTIENSKQHSFSLHSGILRQNHMKNVLNSY